MVKLVQFWNDRNKLTRRGIVWVVLLQLVNVVIWYIYQNIPFATINGAKTSQMVKLAFFYLEAAAGVMALVGVVSEILKKRIRKDDGRVKMADGIWMIKK